MSALRNRLITRAVTTFGLNSDDEYRKAAAFVDHTLAEMEQASDPRLDVGAIVIIHHEAYEPDTEGVVASKPDPEGFADVLILTGNRKGTVTGFDLDLLELCGWAHDRR